MICVYGLNNRCRLRFCTGYKNVLFVSHDDPPPISPSITTVFVVSRFVCHTDIYRLRRLHGQKLRVVGGGLAILRRELDKLIT